MSDDVERARGLFNRRHAVRYDKLDFDKLLDAFRTNKSMTQISREFGMTRQSLTQIYNRYFGFLNETLAMRKERITSDRRNVSVAKILKSDSHKKVIEQAQKHGFTVRYKSTEGSSYVQRGGVYINGKFCSIRRLASVAETRTGRWYGRIPLTSRQLSRVDIVVVHFVAKNWPERFYIIPAQVIMKEFFPDVEYTAEDIMYVPAEPSYIRNHARIFWREYLDRWDLLKT